MAFKHEGPKVLLTEGINDCHVISAICKHHNLSEDLFGLYECGSDEKALKRLSSLLKRSEQEIIGIVIDADNPNLTAKWQAVTNRLQKDGITIPKVPQQLGTIIPASEHATKKFARIGIWLMPNNQLDGMLEDFCIKLAAPAALSFAEKCVNDAKNSQYTTFSETHKTKAVIHTF